MLFPVFPYGRDNFIPLVVLVTCIFAVYPQIFSVVLAFKHGPNFGGLLSGHRTVSNAEDYRKGSQCTVLTIEWKKNNFGKFYNLVRQQFVQKIETAASKNFKILGLLRRYGVYYYILKNQVTIADCIGKLATIDTPTDSITREDLVRLLNVSNNKPMPHNHQVLWEVLIGIQPLILDGNHKDGVVVFPVIFKFHFSNDSSMIETIIENFCDMEGMSTFSRRPKIATVGARGPMIGAEALDALSDACSVLVSYCKQMYYVCSIFAKTFLLCCLSEETNPLYRSKLSHQKYFAIGTVAQSSTYRQRMQSLQSYIPGSDFSQIILATFSSSLGEHYQKKFSIYPKYITVALPELSKTYRLADVGSRALPESGNPLAFSVIRVPIFTSQTQETDLSLMGRVQKMQKNVNFDRNVNEVQVNRFFTNTFFHFFPSPITQLVLKTIGITAFVNYLPGPPLLKIFGDCLVEVIWTFAPRREDTGLTVTLFSYNNKLHLTLTADKVFVGDEEEASRFLSGIYVYLNRLEEGCLGAVAK